MSEIDDKYASMGGPGGWLGKPIDEGAGDQEQPTANNRGRFRDFEQGTIVWSPATGAHEVHGDIRVKWAQLRGESGFLGFPLTDETGTPDGVGRFNHFEGGSIYWTKDTGANEVHGDIRAEWQREGWERGQMGYPLSDEHDQRDGSGGRQSDFQGGSILWWPEHRIELRQRIDDNN
jgi:uncharacterized protein with LGFP repeats